MILVTGCAGFIGMHVVKNLLNRKLQVIGIDSISDYYDTKLKHARLHNLSGDSGFEFIKGDVSDRLAMEELFARYKPTHVVNLAAQAGVRYSLINPHAYIQTNLVGFTNILECCRHNKIQHLVYASSSSVYGSNTKMPFSVHDNVDHPVSLYAATKKSNELMAHSYSHLFGLPTTGLRYFTVYGPWGRPDMSPWLFTEAILQGKPINIFNYGKMQRDFTFVGDIAEGTVRALFNIPQANPDFVVHEPSAGSSSAPYKVYNIGSHQPVQLEKFISTIEQTLGVNAIKNYLPMQSGDVVATYADIAELSRDVGFVPCTDLEEGIRLWIDWYLDYKQSSYSRGSNC